FSSANRRQGFSQLSLAGVHSNYSFGDFHHSCPVMRCCGRWLSCCSPPATCFGDGCRLKGNCRSDLRRSRPRSGSPFGSRFLCANLCVLRLAKLESFARNLWTGDSKGLWFPYLTCKMDRANGTSGKCEPLHWPVFRPLGEDLCRWGIKRLRQFAGML